MLPPALFSPHLDVWLIPRGFARRSVNPRYVRKLGTALQRIDIVLEGRPIDDRSAIAAVYPWLEVSIPEVEREFTAMMGETYSRSAALRQPIEFTSSKRASGRWHIADRKEVPQVALAVGQFIQTWTLPFLDGFYAPTHMMEAERHGDDRILRDRTQIWRAVAATMLEMGPTAASELAERHFSASGLRQRHAAAFQYLYLKLQN